MFPRTLKMTVIAPCVICVKALEKVNCFSSGGLGEKKCYYRPLCRKKKSLVPHPWGHEGIFVLCVSHGFKNCQQSQTLWLIGNSTWPWVGPPWSFHSTTRISLKTFQKCSACDIRLNGLMLSLRLKKKKNLSSFRFVYSTPHLRSHKLQWWLQTLSVLPPGKKRPQFVPPCIDKTIWAGKAKLLLFPSLRR